MRDISLLFEFRTELLKASQASRGQVRVEFLPESEPVFQRDIESLKSVLNSMVLDINKLIRELDQFQLLHRVVEEALQVVYGRIEREAKSFRIPAVNLKGLKPVDVNSEAQDHRGEFSLLGDPTKNS